MGASPGTVLSRCMRAKLWVTRGRKADGTYPLGGLGWVGPEAASFACRSDRLPRRRKLAVLPEVTTVMVTKVPRLFFP